MLELNNSKNLENSIEKLKIEYNSIQQQDEELDEELIKNANGDQLKYIFAKKLNIFFNKWKEEKNAEMVVRENNEKPVLTQKEFAKELDITEQTLSNYLTAKAYPKPNEMERLAKILKTSKEYLYGLTDNPAPIPLKSDLILGLSPNARYSLFKMYHGIEDEDIGDIDIDMPYSDKYLEHLTIFSEFIGNFTNFCDFVTYLKRYVEVKQKINELDKNEKGLNSKLEKEHLDSELLRN